MATPHGLSVRLAHAAAAAWLAAELDLLPAPDRDVLEDCALGVAPNHPDQVTDGVVAEAARLVPCLVADLKQRLRTGVLPPALADYRTGDPGQ